MRLHWFEATGFKNFREPVRLEPMDPVVVIHGANNVGKSNLLEAMQLFFAGLEALADERRGKRSLREEHAVGGGQEAESGVVLRSFDYFEKQGLSVEQIFPWNSEAAIHLRASFALADDSTGASVEIGIKVARQDESVSIQSWAVHQDALQTVFERLFSAQNPKGPFLLIRADRTSSGKENKEPIRERVGLPVGIARRLFEMQERSKGSADRKRFDRYIGLLARFNTMTGHGAWRMRTNFVSNDPELVLEDESATIPLGAMGTGVQQLATLLGLIVLSEAQIVAIEEPELNLKGSVQGQLHELLSMLVMDPQPPAQLVLTSHSHAFETGDGFFLLTRRGEKVSAERRAASDAPKLLSPAVNVPPDNELAPVGYVTTEGLVQFSREALDVLGLPNGGGIVVVPTDDHQSLLVHNQDRFFEAGSEDEK